MYLLKFKILSPRITGGLQWLVNFTAVIYNAKKLSYRFCKLLWWENLISVPNRVGNNEILPNERPLISCLIECMMNSKLGKHFIILNWWNTLTACHVRKLQRWLFNLNWVFILKLWARKLYVSIILEKIHELYCA